MRRIVIVVPSWIREDSGEDALRQTLPTLARMTEEGSLFKVSQMPRVECPEALVLGMPPGIAELRQGPLTVSALGADPPERSTHFHLSLAEVKDGVMGNSTLEPTFDDLKKILEVIPKLNTKILTFVKGEGRGHGLVWEGLGDMHTASVAEAGGKRLKESLPEGDGEPQLRRYIDDSINLLSELELNERRADEDLPLLNLLWPWGNGIRIPLPNLAIRRGSPSLVISSSLRMQGLVRLVGYRNVDRHQYRSGLQFNLGRAAETAATTDSSIVFIETLSQLVGQEFEEERNWFSRELDEKLLTPLYDVMRREPTRITLVSGSADSLGLGVQIETHQLGSGSIPFDLRALDENILPTRTVWEPIADCLSA